MRTNTLLCLICSALLCLPFLFDKVLLLAWSAGKGGNWKTLKRPKKRKTKQSSDQQHTQRNSEQVLQISLHIKPIRNLLRFLDCFKTLRKILVTCKNVSKCMNLSLKPFFVHNKCFVKEDYVSRNLT